MTCNPRLPFFFIGAGACKIGNDPRRRCRTAMAVDFQSIGGSASHDHIFTALRAPAAIKNSAELSFIPTSLRARQKKSLDERSGIWPFNRDNCNRPAAWRREDGNGGPASSGNQRSSLLTLAALWKPGGTENSANPCVYFTSV